MMTEREEGRLEMNLSMEMSLDGASDISGSFTSVASNGSKRGPPSPGPEGGFPLKRVKLTEGLRSNGDAQLAATVFKKFVNSALDEKAAVGLSD